MNDSIDTGLIVVNIADEMFNDGLESLEQLTNSESQFEKWKHARSAIISFAISFETYLNKLITKKLKNIKTALRTNQRNILDFLTKKTANIPPLGFKTIKDKLYLLEGLCGLKKGILIKSYKNFESVIHMRNNIVHYTQSNFNDVYGNDIEKIALKAPDLLESTFKQICPLINEDVPSIYSERTHRLI